MSNLLGSPKTVLALLVTVLAFGAVFVAKAAWSDVVELLKWVLGPWFLATGVEEAAKHVAGAMTRPEEGSAAIPASPPPTATKEM